MGPDGSDGFPLEVVSVEVVYNTLLVSSQPTSRAAPGTKPPSPLNNISPSHSKPPQWPTPSTPSARCPPQRGHIRLLRLHASSNTSAPLIGTIPATTFEASRASYEALSYCWGDNARPDTITLHVLNKGTQPGHPDPNDNAIAIQVRITRSLAEALADFRLPSSDRLHWADALCINQADNAEKSIQVRQMFDVYVNSRRTLVCLGRGGSEEMQAAIAHRDYLRAVNARSESSADPLQTGDPPKAAEFPQAADTGNLVAWDPAVGVVRAGKGTPASAEDESDCLDYRTVAALPDSKADVLFAHDPDIVNSWKNILERPWTTRAWTTQEFVAGPDVLMQLGAGEVTVTVEDLSNLARYLNHDQMWRGPGLLSIWAASAPFLHGPSGVYRPLASPTSVASKVFRMLPLRLSMSEGDGDTTIGQVIGCVRGPGLAKVLNTTDARDVLWSLLALSLHKAVEELQPNYDLGIDEVYRRFSLHIGTAEAGSSSSLLSLPLQMQTGTPSWRLADALEPSREPRFYYNQHREWPRHRVWATANEQGTELTARGTLVDTIVRLAEYVEIEPPLFKGDGALDILSFISTTYMNLREAASWPGLFVLQGESSDEAVFKLFRGISPFARPLEEPPLFTSNARWEQYAHLWCSARAKLRTPPPFGYFQDGLALSSCSTSSSLRSFNWCEARAGRWTWCATTKQVALTLRGFRTPESSRPRKIVLRRCSCLER